MTKTFVPLYTVDAVTGDIIETTWSGDGVIEASQVPEIAGYTPDKTMMENQSQTVYYMLDEEPTVDEKQEEQNVPPKQVTTMQTSVAKEKTAPVKES